LIFHEVTDKNKLAPFFMAHGVYMYVYICICIHIDTPTYNLLLWNIIYKLTGAIWPNLC